MLHAGSLPADVIRVATLPPVVDMTNAQDITTRLYDHLTSGVTILIADMTATTTFTLEGLQALLLVRAIARRKGASLRLAAPRPHIRRYMNCTGTYRLFAVYDTIDAARREPPPPRAGWAAPATSRR